MAAKLTHTCCDKTITYKFGKGKTTTRVCKICNQKWVFTKGKAPERA